MPKPPMKKFLVEVPLEPWKSLMVRAENPDKAKEEFVKFRGRHEDKSIRQASLIVTPID
jgi:hypothetical protein